MSFGFYIGLVNNPEIIESFSQTTQLSQIPLDLNAFAVHFISTAVLNFQADVLVQFCL